MSTHIYFGGILTKRKVDPEGKKEAILTSAASQFARLGFEGASTAEIAKEAGCGIGTVFRIFPTKEALGNAVFQRTCELHARAHRESQFDSPVVISPREQFQRLFQTGVWMLENYPNEYIFYELHHRAPFLSELSQHMSMQLRDRIIRWLETLRDRGAIVSAPSDAIFAIVIGGFVRLVRENPRGYFRMGNEIHQALEDLCWRAIAVERP